MSSAQPLPVRSIALWLVVAIAAFGMLAPRAYAATEFIRVGAFAESGPDGALHHQRKLAVEHSTGNVFRTDVVSDQILVYVPTETGADLLTTFGAAELLDPFGIAIDQGTGDVYVSDAGNARIVRYVTDGQPVPTYSLDATYVSPLPGADPGEIGSFAAPLAIDPTTDDLVVADPGDDLVQRYSSAGAFLGSFDGAGSPSTFIDIQDVAIDSTGDVIVVDTNGGDPASGAAGRAERFSSAGEWEATIGPMPDAANVAVRPFDDQVALSGRQNAVETDQRPTLFMFDSSGSVELSFDGHAQYDTISGIAFDDGPEGRMYVATDTSRGGYPGQYGTVSVQVFEPPPPPEAPTVEPPAASATDVEAFSATLRAAIDPGSVETTYRFEYGPTADYGSQTADASAGAGEDPVPVSAGLAGLQPSTTYHFRIVAENGIGGPVQGADRTFTTRDPAPKPTLVDVTGIGTSQATVNGTADTRGYAGTYRFSVAQVGGPYRGYSPERTLAALDGPQTVAATFEGLPAGATFTARLSMTTGGGTVDTGQMEFATAPVPSPSTAPAPPVFVDPAPYGCGAPKLNPHDGKVRPGQRIVLSGSDLGVFGTIKVGSKQAEVLDYGSTGVAIAVPAGVSGMLPVTVNCGRLSNTIGLGVANVNRFALSLGGRLLAVAVPGKGTVSVRGNGVRTLVKRPAGKATVKLRLALTKAGRTQLAKSKSGKLRRQIKVTYRPAGGSARSVLRTVTFKR